MAQLTAILVLLWAASLAFFVYLTTQVTPESTGDIMLLVMILGSLLAAIVGARLNAQLRR